MTAGLGAKDGRWEHRLKQEPLHIRRLLSRSDPSPQSGSDVLVEYHRFEDDESVSRTKPQVLCQILNIATDPAFCSLRCLHWFEECANHSRRCGLIFEIPQTLEDAPVSLKRVITAEAERPSLGQRLNIARKIG